MPPLPPHHRPPLRCRTVEARPARHAATAARSSTNPARSNGASFAFTSLHVDAVLVAEDVLDHELLIAASADLPVDDALIPLGGPRPVAGTPLDFTRPWPIGARIRDGHEQVRLGRGYDHNFCVGGAQTEVPRLATPHPASRIPSVMEIFTDQPGFQFYSGRTK